MMRATSDSGSGGLQRVRFAPFTDIEISSSERPSERRDAAYLKSVSSRAPLPMVFGRVNLPSCAGAISSCPPLRWMWSRRSYTLPSAVDMLTSVGLAHHS